MCLQCSECEASAGQRKPLAARIDEDDEKPVNASMLLPLCHPLTSHVCLCRSEFKRVLTERTDSSGPSASRDNEQCSNAQVVLFIKVPGV